MGQEWESRHRVEGLEASVDGGRHAMKTAGSVIPLLPILWPAGAVLQPTSTRVIWKWSELAALIKQYQLCIFNYIL